MAKVKIINPPTYIPMSLDLTIPTQVSFLKKRNIDVEALDLNLIFHKEIFSKEYIQDSLNKIKEIFLEKDKLNRIKKEQNLQDRVLKFRAEKVGENEVAYAFCRNNFILKNIEKTISYTTKGKKILNPLKTSLIEKNLYIARRIIFTPYPQMELHNIYRLKSDQYSIFDIFDYLVENEDLNLYLKVYNKYFEKIVDADTKLVVIIANSEHQLLSALTLSNMIKAKYPNIHVCISSYFFTLYQNYIKNPKHFFSKYADTVMIGWTIQENEQTLFQLVDKLIGNQDLTSINNLVFVCDDKLIINKNKNKRKSNYGLNENPTQNYDDFRLEYYFVEENVFPLYVTSGSYWRKNKIDENNPLNIYGMKSLECILHEIKTLQNKYKAKYFNFVDCCLPPSFCKKLSDELLKQKIKINYQANLRPERAFTENLLKQMKLSGFEHARVTLFSTSQRIQKLYNTGINLIETERFIKNLCHNNIYCYLNIKEGLPTQTKEEIEGTIDFLRRNKKYLYNIDTDIFSIHKDSYLAQNLREFGITRKNVKEKFEKTRPIRVTTKEQYEAIENLRKMVQKEIKLPLSFQYTQNVWYCIPEVTTIYCSKYGAKNLKLVDKIYQKQRIRNLRHQAENY